MVLVLLLLLGGPRLPTSVSAASPPPIALLLGAAPRPLPPHNYLASGPAADPQPPRPRLHPPHVLYQVGDSEEGLPECAAGAVCNKIDLYDEPWLERECRCPKGKRCPDALSPYDGHTVVDKTRQLKLCEPVAKLRECRYFRDITWTLSGDGGNATRQVLHCVCPRGAVAYLLRRQPSPPPPAFHYSFACSPRSRLRCQRKEPCRLFTVRKRQELLEEVNTNTLCQCPRGHHCPRHHAHPGVIRGKSYVEENIRTYSGYCIG